MSKENKPSSNTTRQSGKRPRRKTASPENTFTLMEEIERLINLADRVSDRIHGEQTLEELLKALDVLGKNSTRIKSLIRDLNDKQVDQNTIDTFHQSLAQMIEDLKNKPLKEPGFVDGAAVNHSRRDHSP